MPKESEPIDLSTPEVAARLSGVPAICDLVSWLAPLSPSVLADVVRSDPARFAERAGELADLAAYLKSLGAKLGEFSDRLKEAAP